MKRLAVVSMIVLLAVPIASLDINSYWKKVNEAWKNKDYSLGVRTLEEAIIEYPNEVKFHTNLIHFYINNLQFKEGYEHSLATYERFKGDTDVREAVISAHSSYGFHLSKSNNFKAALSVFEGQFKKFPDSQWSIRNYGYVLWKTGSYEQSIKLLDSGIKRYPDMEDMHKNWVWAHWYYGDDLLSNNNHDQAFQHYTLAYEKGKKYYDYMPVNYIYKLLELNKLDDAEKVIAAHPDIPEEKHRNILVSLAWKYYKVGEKHASDSDTERASESYRKAYEKGGAFDSRIPGAYLYKLMGFKKHDEALRVLAEAKKLHGESLFYEQEFWLLRAIAYEARDKGNIKKSIDFFKRLFRHSKSQDKIWEGDTTFSKLAVMNMKHALYDPITICGYWQKFTPQQKSLARTYLEALRQDLHPELEFIYYDLRGAIFYRENNIAEAKNSLDKAYDLLVSSPFFDQYPEELAIPFPLKGIFYAGNNESSKYITHMGLHRHCYDIFGSDEMGKSTKPGTSGSNNSDYYGFGSTIYSPVDGVVLAGVDTNSDATPTSTVNGGMNYLSIESGNNIYQFVHIKQHSIGVQVGQKIKAGQPIAELGNAASTKPHLHFGVYSKDWLISYPVRFTNYQLIKNGRKTFIQVGQPGGVDGFDMIENP